MENRPHKKLRVSSTAAAFEVPPTSDRTKQQASAADDLKAPGRAMSPTDYRCCSDVLEKLMRHPAGRVFNKQLQGKVGTRVFKLVDFETVKSNLEGGSYASAEGFAEDVELTIGSAMEYGSSSVGGRGHIQRLGREVRGLFRIEWSRCRTTVLMKPQKKFVDVSISKSTTTTTAESEISSLGVSTPSRSDDRTASKRPSAGKIRIRIKYPAAGTGRRSDQEQGPSISRESVSDLHESSAAAARSSITSSRSSLEVSTTSVNSVRAALVRSRRSEIERQRELARRKIKAMKNSAGLMDNLESMIEFGKLLKGKQRYSCKVGPTFHW